MSKKHYKKEVLGFLSNMIAFNIVFWVALDGYRGNAFAYVLLGIALIYIAVSNNIFGANKL